MDRKAEGKAPAKAVDRKAEARQATRQDGMRFALADGAAETVRYEMASGADTVSSSMPAQVALEIVNRTGKRKGDLIACGDRTFSASDFAEL